MRHLMRYAALLATAVAVGLGPSAVAHAQTPQTTPSSGASWFIRPCAAYIVGVCVPHAVVDELNSSPAAVVSAVTIDHHEADSIIVIPGETTPARGAFGDRWVELSPGPGRLEDLWSPTMASVARQLDAIGEDLITCGDACLLNVQVHVPQDGAMVHARSKGVMASCALTGTGDVIPPGRLSSIEASGLLAQCVNEYLTDHFGVELPGIVTVVPDGDDGSDVTGARSAGRQLPASASRAVRASFDDRVLDGSSVDIFVQDTSRLAHPELNGYVHYILLPEFPRFGFAE